jgi:hypothetical protein
MNATHLITWSILLLIPVLSLRAQTTDPLWLQAQAHIEGTKNLVASEVAAHTEIIDGDGKNQDTIDKKTRLTGWKDGEPVRSVVSLVETQKSALGDAQFDLGLANHPDKAMSGILTVQRQEETTLDSKSCVVFQVTGQMVKKKKIPFTGKVWIDKATGLPLRVDYTFDPSSIPMTKSMNQSVVYARTSEGSWLPKTVSIDALMSVMFMKIRMTIRQNLDVWVSRP